MNITETANENVTPVGHIRSDVKIYIEQKAIELLDSCQNTESDLQQLFYLLGREYHLGVQRVFVVRSILEGPMQQGPAVTVTPEELRSVDQQRSMQYPGLRLLGWALCQSGRGTKALSRHSRCHVQFFRQTSLLLLMDPVDSQKELYLWNGSEFYPTGGYLIYQEQESDVDESAEGAPVELWNEPAAQNVQKDSMLGRALRDNPASSTPRHLIQDDTPPYLSHYTRKEAIPHYTERSKEPRQFEGHLRPISDSLNRQKDSKRDVNKNVNKNLKTDSKRPFLLTREEASSEGGLHTLSLLTSISAIVLLITVIMGALMFHNLSTLSTIQTHIETLNNRISYMEQNEVIIEDSSVMNETPEE